MDGEVYSLVLDVQTILGMAAEIDKIRLLNKNILDLPSENSKYGVDFQE